MQLIQQRWEELYARDGPSTAQKVHALTAQVPQPPKMAWKDRTGEDFEATKKRVRGAGGPDGWRAEEIQHFPPEVSDRMATLVDRWFQQEEVPKQVSQYRQANIPKANQAKEGCV